LSFMVNCVIRITPLCSVLNYNIVLMECNELFN